MKWGLKSSQHVFCDLYFSFTGYINRIYEMPVRNRNFSVHLTHVPNAIYTRIRVCSSAFGCLKYANFGLKRQCVDVKKVKQSRYRPGVAERVPGS